MPRRAGAFRGQVLLESSERTALQAFLPPWLEGLRAWPHARKLRWSIDVDPVDLY
jgi:primosomal protein N' (replication factor Y)